MKDNNDDKLTPDEIKLLSVYRSLSQMDKGRMLQKAEDLASKSNSNYKNKCTVIYINKKKI